MKFNICAWSRLAVEMAGSWEQAYLALVCSTFTFMTADLALDIETDRVHSVLDRVAVVLEVQLLAGKHFQ